MRHSLACGTLASALVALVALANGQATRCGAGTISVEVAPDVFECQVPAGPNPTADLTAPPTANPTSPKISTSGGNVIVEVPAERAISLKVGDDEITFAGIRAAIGSVARAHGRIDGVDGRINGVDGRINGVDDRLDLEIGASESRASTLTTSLGNLRDELVESLSNSVVAAGTALSTVNASIVNLANGGVSVQLANQTVAVCTNGTVGTLMYNTTIDNVMLCKPGPKWVELSEVPPLGSTEANPAASCPAILQAHPDASNGNYYIRASNGVVQGQFCLMNLAGGGWVHVASINSGTAWRYYASRWTNTAVINGIGQPFDGQNVDRKTSAYSNAPVNEVLFANMDGSKWHHMHQIVGHANHSYDSFRSLIRSGFYVWGKKAASAGGAPWNYPNWAFNNVEHDDDRCWDARINVQMQLPPDGHTGAGPMVGTACQGGGSRNHNWFSAISGTTTYRAVNDNYKQNEPSNLPIDNTRYMNIFVRSVNPFLVREALGSRSNPAVDCKTIKDREPNSLSGVYWLSRGSPYRVYCEMSISGGGWTHIMSVWDNNNADWRYYNARWTNGNTINPQLMGDVHTTKLSRKMGSYMDQPFREFLATNENGKFHHGNNCGGQNRRFTSFRTMIQNNNRWNWFNKRNSSDHTMWNYPNWAFNNVETGSDQCWNARINVCKQTSVAHTGAGGYIGVNCQGNANVYAANFLSQHRGGGVTYRCGGGEPRNLPIDSGTRYVNLFVRE